MLKVMLNIACLFGICFKKKALSTFCFFFILFFIVVVDSQNLNSKELKSKTAKQYYLDGFYNYSDRAYKASSEQFEELSKNYPYSVYTRNSIIMEAYTSYLNKEYEKIQGIFDVFSRLFPDDEYMPYMIYMLAMSYYVSVKNSNRNRDNIIESLEIFTNLTERYPITKYTENVESKISYLKRLQQLNDVTIGEIYRKNGDYIGALKRYTGLFEAYKNEIDPEVEELALCRIIEILHVFNMNDDVKKYVHLLKKKHPDSKCLKKNI